MGTAGDCPILPRGLSRNFRLENPGLSPPLGTVPSECGLSLDFLSGPGLPGSGFRPSCRQNRPSACRATARWAGYAAVGGGLVLLRRLWFQTVKIGCEIAPTSSTGLKIASDHAQRRVNRVRILQPPDGVRSESKSQRHLGLSKMRHDPWFSQSRTHFTIEEAVFRM